MRRFVIVTSTIASDSGRPVSSSSGIRKLKRGVALTEFIEEYMSRFEFIERETFLRGETHCIIAREPAASSVVSWAFTEYKEEDLLHAVSHLTRAELLRDLNELLPLKETVR